MKVEYKDPLDALKYAGLLGHQFVGLDADNTVCCETNTARSAKERVGSSGTVWQQLPKRRWTQVI